MGSELLACDGCGQAATQDHLTRRFKRLEQATRYRPVHIQTVFLAAVSPKNDQEFLYAGVANGFRGEAGALLKSVGITLEGKSAEAALAEFQRQGLLLAHLLECPSENEATTRDLIAKRLPIVLTRLRKSLKPKRVVLMSPDLAAYERQIRDAGLDAEIMIDAAVPPAL